MPVLNQLFVRELSEIYDAELQLLKFLPKLAEAAYSTELRQAFLTHVDETENHIERVQSIFDLIGQPAGQLRCAPIAKFIEEGLNLIRQKDRSLVKDAALVALAQKIEHFEIACYRCLCLWTELIKRGDLLELLQPTIEEEEEADRAFADIVEQTVDEDEELEFDDADLAQISEVCDEGEEVAA